MITPEKKNIGTIFQDKDYRFSVPSYQRNFDRGKDELQELIEDLKDIKDSDGKELFLGNFIFDVSDKTNFKIVDGQQRLTAISIVLIALREHAKKINEEKCSGEIQAFITMSSSRSKEQGNKILVSENIRDVFEYISDIDRDWKYPDKIGNKSVKRQTNKIKPILNYVLGELAEYNKENLDSFIRALLSTYVIVINVQDVKDVFAIFERTNARGLDLNIGDLLKNTIFASWIEEFEELWKGIILNAESSLQRMLKYFWISREGHIQQSQLYKSLKSYASQMGMSEFVNSLYAFSRYYKTAQSQDPNDVKLWLEDAGLESLSKHQDHYERINRVFQALKLFRVTQAYPLIFSILKFYKEEGVNLEGWHTVLFKALDSIENYHFVNNVISGRIGNEVEKFYASKAKDFFNHTWNFKEEMKAFIKDLKSKKAYKEEFVSNFIETITYEQKNIALINYVFDRINNFGAVGGQRAGIFTPEIDLKKRNYNIDHILAQAERSSYKTEEEQEMLDKVGNLLLMPYHSNSWFNAKTPLEKITIMKEDPKHTVNLSYLVQFIKDYESRFDEWDLNDIKNRSQKIAEDWYNRIWDF